MRNGTTNACSAFRLPRSALSSACSISRSTPPADPPEPAPSLSPTVRSRPQCSCPSGRKGVCGRFPRTTSAPPAPRWCSRIRTTCTCAWRAGRREARGPAPLHGWDRPLLTDSGGFQVFSLEGSRRLDEDGVEFQSHVDGGRRTLTPERATEIQWTLGADVAMAFDHVVPGGADGAAARDAMERTLRWLERCARRHAELSDGRTGRQTLWPILQGAPIWTFAPKVSAASSISAPGPVSPSRPLRRGAQGRDVRHARAARAEAPCPAALSYGRGVPGGSGGGGGARVDLFDCVAPTRNGRNGSAFTADGP